MQKILMQIYSKQDAYWLDSADYSRVKYIQIKDHYLCSLSLSKHETNTTGKNENESIRLLWTAPGTTHTLTDKEQKSAFVEP